MKNKLTKKYINDLVYQVNGAAMEVHKALGPSLLEEVYQKFLCHELSLRCIPFKKELIIPVEYKGLKVNSKLRLDILVDEVLPVELKAVEGITGLHLAQTLSYMKLLKLPKGLLINFHVNNLYHKGQKPLVNELGKHSLKNKIDLIIQVNDTKAKSKQKLQEQYSSPLGCPNSTSNS